jgi:uncharacterized membrane protein
MGGKKKIVWKDEWYLYSGIAIVACLSIIVIQISSGTPQTLGLAFSGLAGTYFAVSENWKSIPNDVHRWVVVIAIVITCFVLGVLSHERLKDRE